MEFYVVLFLSILIYLFVLTRKTHLMFKQERIKLNYIFSLLVMFFIFKVHVKIAWEGRDDKRFILFVCKQLLLRYDLALIMLVEVVKHQLEFAISENKVKQETKTDRWFKSRTFRKKYIDILEDECFA
ncbi:hypothetical protein ACFJZL_14515 [Enterococcus faecalis]